MYRAHTIPKTFHYVDMDAMASIENAEHVLVFRHDGQELHVPLAVMQEFTEHFSALTPRAVVDGIRHMREVNDDEARRAKIVRNRSAGVAALAQEFGVPQYSENECPGHVASENDPKICGRCGVHVDELRPDISDLPASETGIRTEKPGEGF